MSKSGFTAKEIARIGEANYLCIFVETVEK